MIDAEHEETAPDAENRVITKLTCSLRGLTQELRILENTIARESYGKESAMEEFLCNYGINPEYRDRIIAKPLRASAVGPDGEVRMVELPNHRFFLATLFVPQMISTSETPHPLIVDFLKAALAFQSQH
jgi:CTP synthase (UTP-ammonia lyase)